MMQSRSQPPHQFSIATDSAKEMSSRARNQDAFVRTWRKHGPPCVQKTKFAALIHSSPAGFLAATDNLS